MSEEKRYVDADALMAAIRSMCNPGYSSSYSSGALDSQVNQLISSAMTNAFSMFINELGMAIDRTAKPYSQCMLCTRKSHDIVPEHPLGDNR